MFLAGRDGTGLLNTQLGTESYMAPEIHARQPYEGDKVDIFALGIVLFIMLCQNPPFGNSTSSDPYYRLLSSGNARFWQLHSRNKPPNFFSEDFKNLISNMLAANPANRLTLQQIQEHPWFNGPTASPQEISQDIGARQERIRQAAEAARARRNNAGGARGVGRLFQGDMSGSITTSMSFSVSQEQPIVVDPLPQLNINMLKYNQYLTGLTPNEIMAIVSHYLSTREAKVNVNEAGNQVEAEVVTETSSAKIKVKVWATGDDLYTVGFQKLEGNHFDCHEIFGGITQLIDEVQQS